MEENNDNFSISRINAWNDPFKRTRLVPLFEPVFYHARTRVVSLIQRIDNLNKLQLIEGPEASNFQYSRSYPNGNSNTILFNLSDIYFPGFKFLSPACYLPVYMHSRWNLLVIYNTNKIQQIFNRYTSQQKLLKRIKVNSLFRIFIHSKHLQHPTKTKY